MSKLRLLLAELFLRFAVEIAPNTNDGNLLLRHAANYSLEAKGIIKGRDK